MSYIQLDSNKKEELKITIYNLRERELSYEQISEELEKQGIKISWTTVRNRCKEIYTSKGEVEPQVRGRKKQGNGELIYNLREQGLTYLEIAQECKRQGIEISRYTIAVRCKEIYESKGEKEPQLRESKIVVQDEVIYNLREQGLTYARITEELEIQGIKIGETSVRNRCKEIYESKGEKEAQLRGRKKQVINDEIIYNLRERGLNYKRILEELEKQGIKLSYLTVRSRCKEIYSSKGKPEPKWVKQEIDEEKIYELREQGLTYTRIAEELEKQGINVSTNIIRNRCKEIYESKGKIEQALRGRNEKDKGINDEQIYEFREQGLSYEKIADKLQRQGIRICSITVKKRCKEIYGSKGVLEPKATLNIKKESNRKLTALEEAKLGETIHELKEQGLSYRKVAVKLEENGIFITRQNAEQRHKRFLKINEQQLAKAILNLTITRKATIEQIQQIAEYYGVDLEKTMNSIEER